MTTATQDRVVIIRAAAFTGQGIRRHRCTVDARVIVRVWDSVAGHYTTCHSLSTGAQAKARKLAAE